MAATMIDLAVFRDIFSTPAMRRVFSDEHRIGRYLEVEAALARVEARLGIIPQEAGAEIEKQAVVSNIDFDKLKSRTEAVGSPVLPVIELGQLEITWHTHRDQFAEVACFLGLVTGTLGAAEIFLLTAGALAQTCEMMAGLQVDTERMRANLNLTNGLIAAEAVMMGLAPYLGRAHDLVGTVCRAAVAQNRLWPMYLQRTAKSHDISIARPWRDSVTQRTTSALRARWSIVW
jgi:adenylosuccinate lyase